MKTLRSTLLALTLLPGLAAFDGSPLFLEVSASARCCKVN